MASNGNPPQPSPGRTILQFAATQPIANPDGTPTLWFSQFIERLISYLGNPGGGGSNGGTSTVTDLLNQINSTQNLTLGSSGTDASTLARIKALENAVPPARPMPMTAALSAALDQVFGSDWGDILFRGQYEWEVLEPGYQNGLILFTGGPNADPYWGIRRAQHAGALASRKGVWLGILSTGVGTNNALSDGST